MHSFLSGHARYQQPTAAISTTTTTTTTTARNSGNNSSSGNSFTNRLVKPGTPPANPMASDTDDYSHRRAPKETARTMTSVPPYNDAYNTYAYNPSGPVSAALNAPNNAFNHAYASKPSYALPQSSSASASSAAAAAAKAATTNPSLLVTLTTTEHSALLSWKTRATNAAAELDEAKYNHRLELARLSEELASLTAAADRKSVV